MVLRKDADLTAFFRKVRECTGPVWFKTPEGDCLNLRSQLCQYIFVAAFRDEALCLKGQILCDQSQDEALFSDFVE